MICFGLESTFCSFVLDKFFNFCFLFWSKSFIYNYILHSILYLNLGISQKMQLKILISGLEIETGWCCQSKNI